MASAVPSRAAFYSALAAEGCSTERFMKHTLFFLLFATIALAGKNTAAKRPFTFEDMMKLKRVNEPVPSPDGKWVVFSAVDVDLAANTKTPHIWIVPADGSAKERLLIATPQGEDRPRWSPDGKYLSFTASYDGSQQVWVGEFDSTKGKILDCGEAPAGATRVCVCA